MKKQKQIISHNFQLKSESEINGQHRLYQLQWRNMQLQRNSINKSIFPNQKAKVHCIQNRTLCTAKRKNSRLRILPELDRIEAMKFNIVVVVVTLLIPSMVFWYKFPVFILLLLLLPVCCLHLRQVH